MDDTREFSSRETRTFGYDPKDQPLRTSDAKSRLHVFRGALEPVLDAPQQTHEVQNWVQVELCRGFSRRLWSDDWPWDQPPFLNLPL